MRYQRPWRGSLRRLSSRVVSRPSVLLLEIDSNARMVEWTRHHPADRICRDRSEMFAYLNTVVLQNEPITYLEFGVHRGRSINEWARLNASDESEFVGFDTFEGLPEQWE